MKSGRLRAIAATSAERVAAETPEAFLEPMKKEIQTWRRVVEQTGIKIE